MNDKSRVMTPLQHLKLRKQRNAVPSNSNEKLSPFQQMLRQERRNKDKKRPDYLTRLAGKSNR